MSVVSDHDTLNYDDDGAHDDNNRSRSGSRTPSETSLRKSRARSSSKSSSGSGSNSSRSRDSFDDRTPEQVIRSSPCLDPSYTIPRAIEEDRLLSSLPDDVMIVVMMNLEPREFFKLAQCSSRFYRQFKDVIFWKEKFRRDFPSIKCIWTDYKVAYMNSYREEMAKQREQRREQRRKKLEARIKNRFKAAAIMKNENLRRNLFATISLHPKGLVASQLCSKYKKQHGVKLDIRLWGCHSVVEFCEMLPQVFILDHGGALGSSEDWMLYSSCHPDCKGDKKHACTIGPEEKIPRQELPGNAKVGEYLEVVIAEVVSPEKFWFQLRGENTNGALVWLMEEIKHFYGESYQRYVVRDEDFLSAGMVCANLHSDGYWYRAVVTSFRDLTTLDVFFIDYGNVFKVKKNSLAYLPRRFGELPGQAFKGRLDGIRPAGEHRNYSKEAKLRFMKLTDVFAENTLYLGLLAMVRGLGEKLSLFLVDTCTNKLPQGIIINQKLVDEGLAVPDTPTTN